MSFSFNVSAPGKTEVKAAVAEKLDDVIATQPIHKKHQALILDAVDKHVDLVDVPDGKQVSVLVSGSLGWSGVDPDEQITGAGFSVSVSLA